MKLGIIGLGKMGLNLALNLSDHSIHVEGYDPYIKEGLLENHELIHLHQSIAEMVDALETPKMVWVMVPAGEPTNQVIEQLETLLSPGDIIIDGGNSRYTESIKRANRLALKQIDFLDVGTSGGQRGAREGACLMIGGNKDAYIKAEPIFKALATENGYDYFGESGSGHFVKMVHNGIEYGMMQAIGEGFDLLKASPFELDYQKVSRVWANGSIIEGLLMDMVKSAFDKDAQLSSIEGVIDDSGEGQWTIEEALKFKVSMPVIAQALFSRYKSKDIDKFSEKLVAAMRNEFGGHKVYKK